MKAKLRFIIATPRSGKSTRAEEWVRRQDEETVREDISFIDNYSFSDWRDTVTQRIIISGDAFRYAVHGHAYINQSEGIVFAAMDIAIRAMLYQGFDVLVDDTHTSEPSILRMLRLDIDAEPIWINTPMNVCIERAYATGKHYLEGPIRRMAAQLEDLRMGWPTNFEKMKEYLRGRKDNDVVAL